MLLAIDIGNTQINWGFSLDGISWESHRTDTYKVSSVSDFSAIIKLITENKNIDKIAISSVVPPINENLEKALKNIFNISPVFFSNTNIPINIEYFPASGVGADRLVNAIAAKELYGLPAILVDLGTATTFCAISEKGTYLGGAIAPGLGISSNALFSKASRLREVELKTLTSIIGKNLEESLNAGIVMGHIGMIEQMIISFSKEFTSKPKVIMTGGWGNLVKGRVLGVDVFDKDLTLKGLWLLSSLTLQNKN